MIIATSFTFLKKNYNLIPYFSGDNRQEPKTLLKSWTNPKFLKSFVGDNRPHSSVYGSTPSCWSNISRILSGNFYIFFTSLFFFFGAILVAKTTANCNTNWNVKKVFSVNQRKYFNVVYVWDPFDMNSN